MKRPAIIIGSALITISFFVLVFAYFSPGSDTLPSPQTSTSSTVSEAAFNEDSLIKRGVTRSQLDLLEQALSQYFESQGLSPTQIDFDSIYRKPTDPTSSSPINEITFMVQLDENSTYKAKMNSFGASQIRLYLYSTDDKLLYDSQIIGESYNQMSHET